MDADTDPAAQRGADPAVVDLLGMMACGELLAFERLAHDAAHAPSIEDKAELARMAVAEFHHFTALREQLLKIGADPGAAMAPFVEPLAEFHRRTAASNWLEGLVKAYVGDGLAADFYREIGGFLDPVTCDLVREVLADTGLSRFAVEHVRAAIEADPRVAGPLALWGRRLMGEALTQAQRVAGERDALVALILGGPAAGSASTAGVGESDPPGVDFHQIAAMLTRLTAAHSDRMAALGLDA